MKVKFSKIVAFTPEWNDNLQLPEGERVKLNLKPMKFDDLMLVMDALGGQSAVEAAREGGAEALQSRLDMAKFLGSTRDILAKYASDLTGLDGDDGALTMEDVVTYPAFMGLAIEVLMKLASISTPSETTEGNSEGQ